MTRTETLLKLLALGGLTYVSIVETMGGSVKEIHEAVAELIKSGAIRIANIFSNVVSSRRKAASISSG